MGTAWVFHLEYPDWKESPRMTIVSALVAAAFAAIALGSALPAGYVGGGPGSAQPSAVAGAPGSDGYVGGGPG